MPCEPDWRAGLESRSLSAIHNPQSAIDLPFLRDVRCAESSRRIAVVCRRTTRWSHTYAPVQTVPRGKNVVRAFLDAAAARILAARAERTPLAEVAGGDSLHVDRRSRA